MSYRANECRALIVLAMPSEKTPETETYQAQKDIEVLLLHHRCEVCRYLRPYVLLDARRNEHCNVVLTTDLSLSFLKAYRTHAPLLDYRGGLFTTASKSLDFEKCQSVHFSAQIARFTLT